MPGRRKNKDYNPSIRVFSVQRYFLCLTRPHKLAPQFARRRPARCVVMTPTSLLSARGVEQLSSTNEVD